MVDENLNGKIRVSVPTVIIGAIGFFVSFYALVVHIQNLMKPGHGSFCDISANFNCSAVIGSSYGELASIPLGAYGMTFFVIMLSAAFLPKFSQVTRKQLARLEFFIGLIGFISVIALFYISHVILKIICPTCSIVHILVSIYFVMKFVRLFNSRNMFKVNTTNSDYFIRFLSVCICLGIPPLAAGLIAPIIIEKYFITPKTSPVYKIEGTIDNPNHTSTLNESKSFAENTKLKELFMTFNKTNYVGNGEDYRRGSDSAKVIVHIFSDFGCPHCREANEPLMQAQQNIGFNKVLVIYHFFPLTNKCNPFVPSEGWYPYSCILPQAARCAGVQGKFWEMKDWGFSGQDWTDEQRAQKFSLSGLKEQAKTLGINADSFAQCVESGVELNKIKDDAALAEKLKIKGTPLIVINGQEYAGPHTVKDFTKAITSYIDNNY